MSDEVTCNQCMWVGKECDLILIGDGESLCPECGENDETLMDITHAEAIERMEQ